MSSSSGDRETFRLVAGRLHRGDELVALTPKELAVLAVLVEASPNPARASDLMSAAWGDAAVGSESLHRCISTLRRKLAGVHDGPAIVTHNRIGYSLAIEIQQADVLHRVAQTSELVRQAMELGARRTRPALERTLERVDQAIALDASYLPAFQLKGHALVAVAMHRYRPPMDVGAALLALSAEMVTRFPSCADGHAFGGFATAVLLGSPSGLEDLDRAVSLDPASWLCRAYRAWALAGFGERARSLSDLDVAWSHNPGGLGLVGTCAYLMFCNGEEERALTLLRQSAEACHVMASAQSAHATVASWLGHGDEAIAAGRRAAGVLEGSPTMAAALCYALARAGEESSAREALSSLLVRTDGLSPAPSMLAPVFVALGDTASAADALARAQEERCVYRHVVRHDPRLAGFV